MFTDVDGFRAASKCISIVSWKFECYFPSLLFTELYRLYPRTYMCNADKLIYIIRIDHEIARY